MAFALAAPLRRPLRLSRPLSSRSSSVRPSTQKRPRKTSARLKPEPTLDALVAKTGHYGVDPILSRNILSQAANAARDWLVTTTDFLTPPESAALCDAASHLHNIHVRAWGGYDDADRTVLVFGHEEVVSSDDLLQVVQDELSVLDLQGPFDKVKATHRDFMGTILNAGVSRAKIGDINVLDTRGAQAVVRSDLAQFLATAVTEVRNVSVKANVIPINEITLPERRIKEMVTVEASLRLDAVASAAFRISRSKMADMVKCGLVRINYVDARGPAKQVKSGDVISARGLGKVEIGEWDTTSKGKYRIGLRKYV